MDKDEYLRPVLRYIDCNPVRAKLVKRAWEHPWSSARHHAQGDLDPLLDEPSRLAEELRRRKCRRYLRHEAVEMAIGIRRMTANGRPLGGAAFRA